ncbi:hypothetical protein SAMN05428947_101556 [Mucilaginibacter sp. OK283]|nr:hypothetical protein SAMN05428947_101556 [Mucilaginibacter sp. OK283]
MNINFEKQSAFKQQKLVIKCLSAQWLDVVLGMNGA